MTRDMSAFSRLAQTVTLGAGSAHEKTLHRIALAPLTRMRNTKGTQIPTDMAVEYYRQRASKNGLIITEATFISKEAGGYPTAPGIYSEEQVAAWKKVSDAVHEKGGVFAFQLWALGRANGGEMPDVETVAPSAIGLKDHPVPREMTEEDIARYMENYKLAAKNALKAGADFTELHGANGYLVDQFLQTVSNKRTDKYGGSIENRMRFGLEALEALISVMGQERVGIRISPWGRFQDMLEEDPNETFVPFVTEIVKRWPHFGYIHLTESRDWNGMQGVKSPGEGVFEGNDALRAIIRGVDYSPLTANEYNKSLPRTEDPSPEHPIVILSAAGHNADNVGEFVERTGDVAAIGRYFIANPDLPERIFKGYPVRAYDRSTFYSQGPKGYTDLPTWEEEQAASQKVEA